MDVEIGQHPSFGGHAGQPFQRQIEMGMGFVRLVLKRINDPRFHAIKDRKTLLRQAYNIAGLGYVAKPEPERINAAMILQKGLHRNWARRSVYGEVFTARRHIYFLKDRRVIATRRLLEAIPKPVEQHTGCCVVNIDRYPLPHLQSKNA